MEGIWTQKLELETRKSEVWGRNFSENCQHTFIIEAPVILLTSLSAFTAPLILINATLERSKCNPSFSTPNSPLRTATLRRQGTEHSWPQPHVRHKFTSSPTHNPNIITHLPASKFTHQSSHNYSGPHHSHSCLKHINTSSILFPKPYMHPYASHSAYACAHAQTPYCLRAHAHTLWLSSLPDC